MLLGRSDGSEGRAARGVGEPSLKPRLLLGLRGGAGRLVRESVCSAGLSGCGLSGGSVERRGTLDLGGVTGGPLPNEGIGVVAQSCLPRLQQVCRGDRKTA